MTRFGTCPKCAAIMEPFAITDARNSRGRWLSAEFAFCPACQFAVFRYVETAGWRVYVGSDSTVTEVEQ